ncbi:MAG: endonuclease/exonuclease/phosphatase family protein, partial [Solirubrobacteraceae bacterium]
GLVVTGLLAAATAQAQIPMSSGAYSQNFDALASSGSSNPWTDNTTLPGWYATRGSAEVATYNAGAGTSTAGSLYSFGTNGVNPASDRALGSLAASGNTYAYGVRLLNDTAFAQTNIAVSYTGEQWRNANGASAVTNTLAFSYRIAIVPLISADAGNAQSWASLSALDFNSPVVNVNGSGMALDGNDPANRHVFTNIVLTGAVVQPGEEIFLRWRDPDDSSSDAGVAVDDLTVRFQATASSETLTNAPVILLQPQSQATGSNGFAIFSVGATGHPDPSFQWQFNGADLPGQTGQTLSLYGVTPGQAGNYSVTVTNAAGATNSLPAALVVTPVSIDATNGAIRFLTYNVNGNGVSDWSTNAAQVQAIGRELVYLNADIIAFNEIPYTNTWQMANWVKAYFPGFYLATNSVTDGYIRNAIASRFPIIRSQSWLGNSSLAPFGGSGSYPRDLFEAQIAVPNWPLPLHVFVAHLKATTTSAQNDANERGAQAVAISNFFVNTFLTGTNATHPYIMAGDMNEDAFFPDSTYNSSQPIQSITSGPTGLQLTTPVNPFGNAPSNAYTESIRNPLDTRFDYILPCAQLFTNIAASEVFRTGLLPVLPSNLLGNDDQTASDHLPVLMVFNNPFNTPFKLQSVVCTGSNLTLAWESQANRIYDVQASADLVTWTPFATNLQSVTTNSPFVFTTNNVIGDFQFFRIHRAP